MGGGEKTTAASLCPLARQQPQPLRKQRGRGRFYEVEHLKAGKHMDFLLPHATLRMEIENCHLSIPYTKPGCEVAILVILLWRDV